MGCIPPQEWVVASASGWAYLRMAGCDGRQMALVGPWAMLILDWPANPSNDHVCNVLYDYDQTSQAHEVSIARTWDAQMPSAQRVPRTALLISAHGW
jgi:hypothetical protein